MSLGSVVTEVDQQVWALYTAVLDPAKTSSLIQSDTESDLMGLREFFKLIITFYTFAFIDVFRGPM